MAKHVHIHIGRKTKDAEKIAINKRTALKMFWDAGFNTDSKLLIANNALSRLRQPSAGYYYADDVSSAIDKAKTKDSTATVEDASDEAKAYERTINGELGRLKSFVASCVKNDDCDRLATILQALRKANAA